MSGMEQTMSTEESLTVSINALLEVNESLFANFMDSNGYSFNVNEDELEIVGEGMYGILYKTFDTLTGNFLALKKIKNAFGEQGVSASIMNEVSILKQLNHENIIKLHTVIMFPNKLFLLLDYIGCDLRKKMEIQQNEFGCGLPENKIKSLTYQIASALDYCHGQRIVHLDIQPKNILIDNNDMIKITNFKWAKLLTYPVYHYTYNPISWYTAPELLLGFKIDKMCADLWSLGCIFAEMISLRPLFPGETTSEQISIIFNALGTPTEDTWPEVKSIFNFDVLYPKVEARPFKDFIPELINKDQESVFNALCICDPEKRMDAHDIMDMEYFSSVAEEKDDED